MISPDQSAQVVKSKQGGSASRIDGSSAPSLSRSSIGLKLRRPLMLGTLAVASASGAVNLYISHLESVTERTYGTRLNPRFRILPQSLPGIVRTLRQIQDGGSADTDSNVKPNELVEHDKKLHAIDGNLNLLARFLRDKGLSEGEVARWRSGIKSQPTKRAEFEKQHPVLCAKLEELRGIEVELYEAAAHLGVVDQPTVPKSQHPTTREVIAKQALGLSEGRVQDLEARYGSAELYAKDIFKQLTGQALPDSVQIERVTALADGVAASTNEHQQRVLIQNTHFANYVAFLSHEFGHLVSLHYEGVATGFTSIFKDVPREVMLLEEASSYAFQRVATAAIPDAELRQIAIATYEMNLMMGADEYAMGGANLHCEAMVVADAACQLFGDPIAAFNHLATTTQLSAELRKTLSAQASMWQDSTSCTPAVRLRRARILQLCREICTLQTRYDPNAGD